MKLGMLRAIALFIAAGAVFFAYGCQTSRSDKDLVGIHADEAMQLVQGKKSLPFMVTRTGTWVDSRSEADFRAGHIPGAINLPYERVNDDHGLLKDYKILIVYGNDYNDNRAEGMSKRLMSLGHGDVRTLIGGLRAWKTEGNPVETSEGK